MLTVTLNEIKAEGADREIMKKLLAFFGKTKADDDPVPLADVMKAVGVRALLGTLPAWTKNNSEVIRFFICRYLRINILPIYAEQHPEDDRLHRAVEDVEYAVRELTDVDELSWQACVCYSIWGLEQDVWSADTDKEVERLVNLKGEYAEIYRREKEACGITSKP